MSREFIAYIKNGTVNAVPFLFGYDRSLTRKAWKAFVKTAYLQFLTDFAALAEALFPVALEVLFWADALELADWVLVFLVVAIILSSPF